MSIISRRKMMHKSYFALLRSAALASIALLTIASSCARKHHRNAVNVASAPRNNRADSSSRPATTAPPPAVAPGYVEEGVASWYGIPYHGRAAADGEIYDMETLVAAHRLLPFNTWLRVTNLSNNKSVNVRIIDRGPFVRGRILDLSKAAARNIDLLGPGVGKIRLEVISAPPDRPTNDYYAVQIGAFAVRSNAEQARTRLASRFGSAYIALKHGNAPLWRVLVGKEPSVDQARELAKLLYSESKDVFVVRLDEAITTANSITSDEAKPLPANGAASGALPLNP